MTPNSASSRAPRTSASACSGSTTAGRSTSARSMASEMRLFVAISAGIVGLVGTLRGQAVSVPPISLVVLVSVDQMRADYLARFAPQWTGGFARIYRRGTVFEHGEQDHAATETAPGHSTMLSGRYPAHTGIALN